MHILVTGATGFVGSHAAKALAERGHTVRVLVRDPEKAKRVFDQCGFIAQDQVVGDATDRGLVRSALEGCNAVVHTAAVVSMRRKDAVGMYRTNTNAADAVLGQAAEMGLDPVVNLSSASVFELIGKSITLETPLRMADSWYSRSKVEVERFARGLQVAGAPVVSLYPSGIFGPNAPEMTAMHNAAVTWINTMPVLPSGFNMVDIDDVTTAICEVMAPGAGPKSFMLGGHFLKWGDLANTIEEMTGVRLKRMAVPGPIIRGLGRFADASRIPLPTDFPLTAEAMKEATRGVPIDSSPTLAALNLRFTDRWTTLRRGYEWLIEQGLVSADVAGNLAPRPKTRVYSSEVPDSSSAAAESQTTGIP